MFTPQEVLRTKRDGGELTREQIRRFVAGITSGEISPAQTGAFTMATYLQGMTTAEIVALVLAMRDSGRVADWASVGADTSRVIEKHSSGGVGDEKITLLVVPIVAAAGVLIPNMSAWGLDYCPGEIDMLDAIPGYRGAPSVDEFMDVVVRIGGAVIGPSPELAPADGKIFKVRDTTATVESVALITGSIMSKKLAANPSGVVITVGRGTGAFMHTFERALELATSMRDVATGAGIPSVLMVTDLDSVLGTSVGSAVEMLEVVDFLTGTHRERRTLELTLTICAEILMLAGLAASFDEGWTIAERTLSDGRAAAKFDEILEAQGCAPGFVANARDVLPVAPVVRPVFTRTSGYIAEMATGEVGLTLVQLGGGRTHPDDGIDFTVGFTDFAALGDRVDDDRPLCTIHARTEEDWGAAADRVLAAVRVSPEPVAAAGPVVLTRLEGRP